MNKYEVVFFAKEPVEGAKFKRTSKIVTAKDEVNAGKEAITNYIANGFEVGEVLAVIKQARRYKVTFRTDNLSLQVIEAPSITSALEALKASGVRPEEIREIKIEEKTTDKEGEN